VLHNARARDDGRWAWRYDQIRGTDKVDFARLWDDVAAITAPIMLVRGDRSPVVDDADVEAFRARQPDVRYELVAGAGHSIQGDQPLELAALIDSFVDDA
jgi:pimeloyl-ACP methyl ester carboxylesterase